MGASDLFQSREKEIFATLHELKSRGCDFVLIGGYAVNAYTLPRFSVDCDLVVKTAVEARRIESVLKGIRYTASEEGKSFKRLEKEVGTGLKVAVDVLIGDVLDRQSGASFTAEWVFRQSAERSLKGKTIVEELELKVISLDALVAMKFVSGRAADIRDVFMLLPEVKDLNKLKEEISSRANFDKKFEGIKEKTTSEKFRNDLQGIYGYIDDKIFERHRKAVLDLGELN